MSAIINGNNAGGFSIQVDPAQMASYVYTNVNPFYVRLIWDYAFVLLPTLVLFGSILFRFGGCMLSCCCGLGNRACNMIACFIFASSLILISLLFVALYPVLDNGV